MMGGVMVLGLGNPDRGDDGIGAAVVQRLAGWLPQDVASVVAAGDVVSLIGDWEGRDALICVDAAGPLGAPGRVHRIDLCVEDLPRDVARASSHDLGLAEAIALARALDLAPPHIIVFAVEGACFTTGTGLTPDVAACRDRVAGEVLAEIRRLRRLVARDG